ncbi:MAG: cobalt ECF transporter T component CbiQ [bacterium]|nr:cobalt ECF transporter T component CbiQ [bacterium]
MVAADARALYVHGHSVVHRLAPEAKVAATFLFVLCAALTPRTAIWAFGVYGTLLAVVVMVAGIPLRFLIARLVVVLPFVLFAFLVPIIGEGERVQVLGIPLSLEGLWAMWGILAKAGVGATSSILLAGTTEVPDLLKGLTRLRVPPVFVSITSFMVRYMELMADSLGRMRTAMVARGYDPRWLWQAKPIASSAGALFVRSYERGERIHAAMLSRGYTGVMPDLTGKPASVSDWLKAAPIPLLGLITVTIALVTQ